MDEKDILNVMQGFLFYYFKVMNMLPTLLMFNI
jgi:hypothetical protein